MSALGSGQAAAAKMIDPIERRSEIDIYNIDGQKLEDVQGDVELRDAYFSYPTKAEQLLTCNEVAR